jgi:hypothetical protein
MLVLAQPVQRLGYPHHRITLAAVSGPGVPLDEASQFCLYSPAFGPDIFWETCASWSSSPASRSRSATKTRWTTPGGTRFDALGVGLGFATGSIDQIDLNTQLGFLFPRCRAGLCNVLHLAPPSAPHHLGFYALGVGLGFATSCPLKTWEAACFYALGVGLGFATDAL